MNDRKRIEAMLEKQQYMFLSVVLSEGTPWVVPVKIQLRQGNTFEWDSKLDTRHSTAIEDNPSVAITIIEAGDTPKVALYASGVAELVEKKDHGLGRYRVTVRRSWMNDETYIKREMELS